MKTRGQRLYEYKYPKALTLYTSRAPWAEAVSVPCDHTPWRLLTDRARAIWETSARGHWIFSGEDTCES